jgi:protein-L-isoaspartate(D-aspartate) O-methyltransferase
MAKQVLSLEIFPSLKEMAQKNLQAFSNIELQQTDGIYGLSDRAPFDVIMVGGAYPLGVPQRLCDQLAIGGRLFAICGSGSKMEAVLIKRHTEHQLETISLFETETTPLLNAPIASPFQF